jgi:DNA-directed RNA polymerase subunit M/transcription elongation factor TFIIS
MPTNETCPECGGMLFSKKGRNQLVCKKEGCTFKKEAPKTEAAETEE